MSELIESDYLIIGAGGMGMAFVDEVITHSNATITIVDRHHQPGGHWNDAYPFVRLHQTSTTYGVNSTDLGGHRLDVSGLNKGCYELASGSEVVSYFDNVMRRRFLPSGRVRYLPLTDYRGDSRAVSLGGGNEYRFRAGKIVDATYLNVSVPSQRDPQFEVSEGALVVAVNALPEVIAEHEHFVIVGSGKTGMDAVLFLLTNGVAPERITWIMPADAWIIDRFNVAPGRGFDDAIPRYTVSLLECVLLGEDYDHFFRLIEERNLLMRIDPSVRPRRWRCATVTPLELDQLRRVKNILRKGHLQSASPTEMTLQQGKHATPQGAVYVDCAADGLPKVPEVPVFDGNKITLQTIRQCQQVYSAGFIANIELNVDADQARKNALTQVVRLPYEESDLLHCAIGNCQNLATWLSEPAVVKWINESRIDQFSPLLDFNDPETAAKIQAMGGLIEQALPKLASLVASA